MDNISLTSATPNPICGNWTIDNTQPTNLGALNFNSFTDAINHINLNGTCGPLTFNVAAGQTFAENTPVITATGTFGNTITFQRNGVGANPVITPTGGTGTTDAGITVQGGDYFTFNGIDIDASAVNTVEYGYLVRNANATNGAQFNTFENFTVTLNRTNATSRGVMQTSSTTGGGVTPTDASGNNNSNTYRNFNIRNAFSGFWALTGSTTWWDDGTTITTSACGTFNSIGDPNVTGDIGNAVTTQAYGIQMTNQNGFVIENTEIRNVTNTTGQLDGINVVSFSGQCRINNCVVRGIAGTGSTTTAMSGIRATHSTTTGVPAPSMAMYNNLIAEITRASTTASATRGPRGIYLNSTSATNLPSYEIWNNTVKLDGSANPLASNACFETTNPITGATFVVRNNIFANYTPAQGATAKHYGFVHTNNAAQVGNTGSAVSNNDIYIANDLGTSGFTALSLTTNRNGVAAWQGAVAQATANIEADPGLLITLESAAAALDATGFSPAPAYLTLDFGCAPRQADIGAYNLDGCVGATAGTIDGSSSACDDDASVVLTLNGSSTGLGISYQWRYGTVSGVYDTNGGTSLVEDFGALGAGTYYIVVDVTCSAGPSTATTAEFTLTINPNPTALAGAVDDILCEGENLDLTGGSDIATGWDWTGPNGFASSLQNPTITGVSLGSAGSYTLITEEAGCFSTPSSVVITVNPLPVFTAISADPNPICANTNSQLSATALVDVPYVRISEVVTFKTGTGGGTYPPYITDAVNDFIELNNTSGLPADISGWSIGDYASNATTTTHPLLTFPSGTVIAPYGALVVGMGAGDGGDPGNNYFVMGGSNDFWSSGSVMGVLLRDAGNGIIDVMARGTFTWNPALGVSPTDWTGTAPGVSGNAGTVRTASLDTNDGSDWTASGSATVTMGVYNSAYSYVNPDQSVPASYLWSPATFLDDPNLSNPLASSVTATTPYTVTATSAAGCEGQSNITLTVAPPVSGVQFSPIEPEFCAGSYVDVTASPVDGGAPFAYQWTDPNNNPAGTDATQAANIGGTWTVSITDNCGGSPAVSTVFVLENPTPSASATAGQACLDGTLDLDGTTDIGTTYAWTGPNSFSSTDEDPTITPVVTATGGTYTFTSTLNGCTSAPATVNVTVDPSPIISSITATPNPVCTGTDAQLSVVAFSGYTGSTIPFAPVSGTGIPAPSQSDDGVSTNIPIGFSFPFYGTNYTTLNISCNGFLSFTSSASGCCSGQNIPSATDPNAVIALAWEDLNVGSGGSISYYNLSAPDRFVVEFNAVPFYVSGPGTVTAQAILFADGTIEIHSTGIDASGQTATQGIENQDGTAAIAVPGRNASAWTATNDAYRFSLATNTYAWTPNTFLSQDDVADPLAVQPNATTAYSVLVTSSNNCTATGNVTLTVNQTPDVELAVVQDCVNEQYSISVQVNSTGDGPTVDLEYTVNGGTPILVTGLGTGAQTPLGPFNQLDELVVTVIDPVAGCNSAPQPFVSGCPELVDCALEEVLVKTYCYGNNDTRAWLFQTADGLGTLTLQFIQGEMALGDVIRGYSGTDNNGAPIDGDPGEGNLTGNFPNLGGVTGVSSGSSLYIEIDSDGSGSCQDAGVTIPWQWQVQCTPSCIQPDAAITYSLDCTAQTYDLSVEILDAGDISTSDVDVEYRIGLNGTPQVINDVFLFDFAFINGINLGDTVYIVLLHQENPSCDKNMGFFTHGRDECPNDEPCSAWILPMNPNYTCTDVVAGDISSATLTAGITGGCSGVLQDQWYRFTATAPTHRVQLSGTTTGLSHSIYEGPDCNTLSLVAGTACTAGATASNPAGLTIGQTYYVRVSRTTLGTNAYNVCVSAPPLLDVDATVLALPTSPACYGAAETVSVTVLNNSVYTLDLSVNPVTVNVNVTGAATASLSGTLSTGSVAPAATFLVPMSTTLDMSVAGTYTFNGSAVVVGDGNATNDAMTAASRTTVAPTALPITQNFTGFSGANLLTLGAPNNGWREATGATAPGTGTTSAWTSSVAAQQTQLGTGVSAKINLFTTTRNEWLLGPKFIPQLGTVLRYSIAITNFGSGAVDNDGGMQGTDDKVSVMISTDCGGSWSPLFVHNAGNTSAISNSLVQQQIDLSVYEGQEVLIGFLAQDGPIDNVNDYDFHVDDINILNVAVCAGPPVAGTASSSVAGPVCAPASTTLSVSGQSTDGGVAITWWGSLVPGGPYTINQGSGTVIGATGLTVSTYWVASVKCLNTNDSTLTNEVSIQVTPTPSASASAGPACTDQDLDLTGTTDFGTSFTWTGPNSFSSTDQNPTVSPVVAASAGTYTFTATANGCSTQATVAVTVNTTPVITSLTASPNPICENTGTSQLNAAAPVSGYVMGSGGASFIDISGTGDIIPAPAVGDDNEHPLTIPAFTFNGVTYTTATVGDNGAMVFGSSTFITNVNANFPATFGDNVVGLAPFWDDLDNLSTTQIYTQQVGNLFIVQWSNWGHFSATVEGLIITFQLQLDLSTGQIFFVYQDVSFGGAMAANDAGASATVGIQWANSAGNFLLYSFNTASLSDGQVISFTPNQASFLWTPNTNLSADNIADPVFGPTTQGSYVLNVTATAAGCTSAPSQITIDVNPALQAGQAEIVPASPSFCSGGDVLLTANPLGGGGPFNFQWTDPNAIATGFGAAQSISANIPGTWTVDILDACGGTASASIVVTEFPTPVVLAGSNSPVCEGSAINLSGNSDVPGSTFSWTGPNSFSSTDEDPVIPGATLSMSGDYTLVATANGCSSDPAVATVSVGSVLTGVSASASPLVVCAPGGTIDLFSTGAGGNPNILVEDFNGAATDWTTTNTSTGGTPANAAWTLRPNGYVGPIGGAISSNDASQFYMSDSDDQGSGGTTNTTLVSPAFSLVGYTSASLSFWHHYNWLGDDNANVEISTDGGGSWNSLVVYSSDQGSPAAFANANLPLTAYLGMGGLRIRFRYFATWDWYWAIDNVSITGTPAPATFSWSSNPSGFSSTDQNPTGVAFSETTVYTVTVEALGCTADADVTVYLGNNDLTFEFETDGNASEISWELYQDGTNLLLQSGSGLPDNAVAVTVFSCLPDGCFYLRVLDAGGDGIANGGYILREGSGNQRRIIDNRDNFSSGSVSAIANNGEFCLPLGDDRLIYTSNDKLDWRTTPCQAEYIVATDNPAVTAQYGVSNANSGYQMWWFDPNGGYSFRRFQSHNSGNGLPASATRACHFKLNSWTGNQLQEGVLYNVKVRGRVAGVWNTWGSASRFMIDNSAAQCPRTKLMDIPGNPYLSCGAMREIGTTHYVHAVPKRRMQPNCSYKNANRYQFRFRIAAENIVVVKTSQTGQYWVNTNGLECGKTYDVDVRVSFDNGATWCIATATPNDVNDPAWGDVCQLTTTCGQVQGGTQNIGTGNGATLRMYPNPNRGDQLFLNLDAVEDGVRTISVDIYDGFGKRVSARTIAVQDGFVNTVLELNGELATGMYLVNITAGEQVYTERLVVQP